MLSHYPIAQAQSTMSSAQYRYLSEWTPRKENVSPILVLLLAIKR